MGYIASADFDDGAQEIIMKLSSETNDSKIEIHLDQLDGELVGTIDVPNTGGSNNWVDVRTAVSTIKGIRDIYFVFKGNADQPLLELASWSFK